MSGAGEDSGVDSGVDFGMDYRSDQTELNFHWFLNNTCKVLDQQHDFSRGV